MGRREAFDPLQQYVANRTFAFGAHTYVEGEPFNDRNDMRRLRQLYDGRYIRMAPERLDVPKFKAMTEDQLKTWLIDAGFATLAHPRSPHVRLVERAQRVWAEQQAARLANPDAPSKAPRSDARAEPEPEVQEELPLPKPQRERLARPTRMPLGAVKEKGHAARVRL